MCPQHDPYVASEAFAGYAAPAVPIMPGLTQSPPQNAFAVNTAANLVNWQFIQGEEQVSAWEAWSVINTYYTALGSSASVAQISQSFVDYSNSVSQGYGAVLVPGDSAALQFAGLYTGLNEIQTYHTQLALALQYNTPLQVTHLLPAATPLLCTVAHHFLVLSWSTGSAGDQCHQQRQRGHVLALERRGAELSDALLHGRL